MLRLLSNQPTERMCDCASDSRAAAKGKPSPIAAAKAQRGRLFGIDARRKISFEPLREAANVKSRFRQATHLYDSHAIRLRVQNSVRYRLSSISNRHPLLSSPELKKAGGPTKEHQHGDAAARRDGARCHGLATGASSPWLSPGNPDNVFGLGTEAAVLAFQKSAGLLSDGIAGPRTLAALGIAPGESTSPIPGVTVVMVSTMFPHTPIGNIKQNLPFVLGSLVKAEVTAKPMVLTALATIRAETESFEPIPEGPSRYNSSPNGHPFDLYDNRRISGTPAHPMG